MRERERGKNKLDLYTRKMELEIPVPRGSGNEDSDADGGGGGTGSQSIFFVCYERWDWDKFEELRQLPMPTKETDSLMKRIEIDTILRKGALRIPVRYTTKKGFTEGRVYGFIVKKTPVGCGDGGAVWQEVGEPLQRLPRWIRRFISHEYYRDFDIVNCAPVLLKQILDRHNLCPGELTTYLTERESLFAKYNHSQIPRADMKRAFLKVFHMGAADERIKETSLLKNAVKRAMLSLSKLSEYTELYKVCCVINSNNAIGTFVARVWQKEESRVLMKMREYLINLGYRPERMVLCFDGLMLEIDESVKEPPDLLGAMSIYIRNELQWDVTIEEKSLLPTPDDFIIYNQCKERFRQQQQQQ